MTVDEKTGMCVKCPADCGGCTSSDGKLTCDYCNPGFGLDAVTKTCSKCAVTNCTSW